MLNLLLNLILLLVDQLLMILSLMKLRIVLDPFVLMLILVVVLADFGGQGGEMLVMFEELIKISCTGICCLSHLRICVN